MSRVLACGDCARTLLDRGGKLSEATTIDLGHLCEVHPNEFALQATNAIEVEGGLDPVPSTMPPPFSPAPSLAPDVERGLLTELSARLLVAWSSESKGAGVDDLMIGRAVDVARRLLAETEGA